MDRSVPVLVTTKQCPKCVIVKDYMHARNFVYEVMEAEKNMSFCRKEGIMIAPTLLVDHKLYFGVDQIKHYVDEVTGW